MPVTSNGLVVTDPSIDVNTLTKRQLEENVKCYSGSTIPDHLDISKCPHRLKGHGKMFDILCKYWRQQKERDDFSDCTNAELLKKEFHYMLRRENCEFCFWQLIFKNLPGTMKAKAEEPQSCNDVFLIKVNTTKEYLDSSLFIQRLTRQTETPLTAWMYCVSEDGLDVTVSFVYKTQKNTKMLTKQLNRILGTEKGCSRYTHTNATRAEIEEIMLDEEPAQRHGDVWSEFE